MKEYKMLRDCISEVLVEGQGACKWERDGRVARQDAGVFTGDLGMLIFLV